MKTAARLTANLLASKGDATPALQRQRLSLAADRSSFDGIGRAQAPMPPAPSSPTKALSGTQSPKRQQRNTEQGDKVTDKKRIALTLRLDKERHLRLKLMAAHTNKSAQDLLMQALDDLLGNYTEPLSGCPCLNRSLAQQVQTSAHQS
ncbi:hypothetical protein JCM17844_12600 [Iodidimonas gelatinilytica]|uniref:Antitoxin-like ribbon-helix-helix domain-containing protein n=1 Tax=Iodidimonas gelatinilytica TaxID=1236966 RepID=A0A5A7N3F5_9PROT|nr:hypothetical protein JCM17844_12600 [Iodidimonas gelatinilytica]GER01910.1 hypothetical protein JCM17845_25330 [Iodidimonas gelatinilytica]